MKKLGFITVAILFLLGCQQTGEDTNKDTAASLNVNKTLTIQEVENSVKDNGKYAMFISNPKRLGVALLTGEQLKEKSAKIKFQVVMAGPVLRALANDTAMLSLVKKAQKDSFRLVACQIAMNHMNLTKEDLPDYVEVTNNAAIYLYGLKELGYKTL